ncbi:MAG: hypothetical protein AAGI07_12285, partial [Bacteroidota bacterium]
FDFINFMITPKKFNQLFPLACQWAIKQETLILETGISLDKNQQMDASQIGIQAIKKIRLLRVEQIPKPPIPELKEVAEYIGLLSPNTVGITFRYGIYIRSDFWNQRRLVVHELTHTLQYERLGGIQAFHKQYLNECITLGYQNSPLELEARNMEQTICN